MDCVSLKDQEIVIDIDNFDKTSTEVAPPSLPGDIVSISVDEVVKSDNLGNFSGNQKSVDEVSVKNSKREKRKSSGKKPPKPPRPSTGLWLDAADQKLIKEITELAMMKRARVERMKKMKVGKTSSSSTPSSSSGSLLAMMFTIIFCIVIILQGKLMTCYFYIRFDLLIVLSEIWFSIGCHSSGYSRINKPPVPSLGSLEPSNQIISGVPLTSIGSPNVMEPVLGSDSKDVAAKAIH
ncbi:hypothetical protein ACS0TY_027725 [Phlomoides rotata]